MALSGADGRAVFVKFEPLFVIAGNDFLKRISVEFDVVGVAIDSGQQFIDADPTG